MIKLKEVRVLGLLNRKPAGAGNALDGALNYPYGADLTVYIEWERTFPWENLNTITIEYPDGNKRKLRCNFSGRWVNGYPLVKLTQIGDYIAQIADNYLLIATCQDCVTTCPVCGDHVLHANEVAR